MAAQHHLFFVLDAQVKQVRAFLQELLHLQLLPALGRGAHRFGAFVAGDNKVAEVKGVQVDGWAVVEDGWQVAAIGQGWLGSADGTVGHLHGCFLHGFLGLWAATLLLSARLKAKRVK